MAARVRERLSRVSQRFGHVIGLEVGERVDDLADAHSSAKNQITLPVAALQEAGLRAGEAVTVEPTGDGELRVRRAALAFEDAFGAITRRVLARLSRPP